MGVGEINSEKAFRITPGHSPVPSNGENDVQFYSENVTEVSPAPPGGRSHGPCTYPLCKMKHFKGHKSTQHESLIELCPVYENQRSCESLAVRSSMKIPYLSHSGEKLMLVCQKCDIYIPCGRNLEKNKHKSVIVGHHTLYPPPPVCMSVCSV